LEHAGYEARACRTSSLGGTPVTLNGSLGCGHPSRTKPLRQ
jgi:hypothetical protein